MDSRNIKEPTPQIEDGKHLEKIYDLQKNYWILTLRSKDCLHIP